MSVELARPLALEPNPVRRAHYGAGALIRGFRAEFDADPAAEDWLSSDLRPRSAPSDSQVGLGRVVTAPRTSELIAALETADAHKVLGSPSATCQGYLAKLLCPDRRIPIHCHPSRSFAHTHLSSRFGKTEAWIVVATDPDPRPNAWVGFRNQLSRADWYEMIRRQNSHELLAQLHGVHLNRGDVAYVPAGTPHAIGPGILVIEPQEASDWSILAEYAPFSLTAAQATLDLGWDIAINSFDMTRRSTQEAETLHIRRNVLPSLPEGVTPILGDETAGLFRASLLKTDTELTVPGGSCWTGVAITGEGIVASKGGSIFCTPGATFFVPACSGQTQLKAISHKLAVVAIRPGNTL